jgi:putative ABC transport system substrate-binding protein
VDAARLIAAAVLILLFAAPADAHNHQRRLAELLARARLPGMVPWRHFVESGGLMSYGADVPDLFRRAAGYADRIVKGAKPADMPVEQAVKFEMLVNLRAARALGLTIPQTVVLRASEVIQ